MRVILQRVESAAVRVAGQEIASIGRGVLLLVGFERGDGHEQVDKAARKIAALRFFEDADGRMNLDLATVGGAVLVVSQFTLAGSLARGRRPSFSDALEPQRAEPLIGELVERLRQAGLGVKTGKFGADMKVELINDGPVTFVLDVPAGKASAS